jgi:hypothetical protein
MKRAFFASAVAVLFAAGLMAQAKPDFSGSWTLDVEKSVMPQRGGGGGGGRGGGGMAALTIKVDGATMTSTREGMNGAVVTTYMLDGTESKNMQMARGGQSEATYTSKWDGAKLVTTIVSTRGTSTESRWIEADGTMVVETVRTGQDGTPMTTKLVYKKN